MSDDLSGLESYVEAVRTRMKAEQERLLPLSEHRDSVNWNGLAQWAVLALAEPLRRAGRVEELLKSLGIARKAIDVVSGQAEKLATALERGEKRIEELEPANTLMRAALKQTGRTHPCCRALVQGALLDTEAKP